MFEKTIDLTDEQLRLISYLYNLPQEDRVQLYKALFRNNWSLRQLFPELPHEAYEKTYATAKRFYEVGEYNAALPLFYSLACYDQHCFKYLLGTAACLHLLEYYPAAAQAYTFAWNIEPNNPVPLFYAAECLEKMGGKKEALFMIKEVLLIAGHRKEYHQLKQKAELIRARLERNS